MREAEFLEQQIVRLWKLSKIPVPPSQSSYQAKLKLVTGKLIKFAQEKKVPVFLILNEYAYSFGFVHKEVSLNKIYIRLGEFMDKYSVPEVDLTGEDLEFADKIELVWNSMHQVTSKNFPFSFGPVLRRSKAKIMDNTFFKHDHNFRYFCMVANFVRRNRKFYPRIQNMAEFFLHLPLIWNRPGTYVVWQYLDPEKTLERYYCKVYGTTPKAERFDKFVSLYRDTDLQPGLPDIWGVQEMEKADGKKSKEDTDRKSQPDKSK